MAESERADAAEVEALIRLEAALERISQHGPLSIPPAPSTATTAAPAAKSAATDAAATRIDALIAQLRGALDGGQAALAPGEGED